MGPLKSYIIGISEANIERDYEKSEQKISGYDMVTNKLMKTWGQARSAMFVKSSLKYKVRFDLMGKNCTEVWIYIGGAGRQGTPFVVGSFFSM